MSKIVGGLAGCYSPLGRTMVLQDESGNELAIGVVIDQEKKFDAKVTDVRINKNFVNDEGALIGENTITYRTEQGYRLISPNQDFVLPLKQYNHYNYTKLQCMFAPFNTSINDSMAVDKIVLNDSVFSVNSAEEIASVTKDDDAKSINFNITNTSESIYLIYYFTYCQEEI